MRTRLVLLLWILGILFPLAWLGKFSPFYRNIFLALFSATWVHVLMHVLLFAGLAIIVDVMVRFPLNRKTIIITLGFVIFVGLLQEGLQALSQTHFSLIPALTDLGVDICGGFAGLGLLKTYQYLVKPSKFEIYNG